MQSCFLVEMLVEVGLQIRFCSMLIFLVLIGLEFGDNPARTPAVPGRVGLPGIATTIARLIIIARNIGVVSVGDISDTEPKRCI